jgi:2-methylcitrate dehydratase PrpD
VILDTLGTALGGYQTRLGQLAAGYAAYRMPGEESTLVADGRSSSAEGAAWANGTMSKILGMDDTSRLSGHVASELVPTVLALGEQLRLGGRELITARAWAG